MQTIKNIYKTDFNSIPIDTFWNTGTEKELKMHRIHSYPAKFPAFITTKAIEYAKDSKTDVKVLADIFCGCGTTAYEAKRNNIDFWGCDINPVATMIALTKSQKYKKDQLQEYFFNIINKFKSTEITNQYYDANPRLKYWFKEYEYNNLFHLKNVINETIKNDDDYKRFFLCAYSNILKSTSVWLTKSIKPQVDPIKKPADVLSAFIEQCTFMILANDQNSFPNNSKTDIVTENFLSSNLDIPMVDLIITSPPYVTSYEYADLHQLSSLWLDYAEDYRDLREGSIGSVHHEFNFNKEFKRLNETGNRIVSRLIDQKSSKKRSVAKYFLDMQNVTEKTHKMLNSNGLAIFVIANTEYKGVIIDNAKHLAESLFNSGFSEVSATKRKISKKILTPYRDENGKFTTNAEGRMIYSEEFLVIGRK